MYASSKVSTKALTSQRTAGQLYHATHGFHSSSTSITKGLRASYSLLHQDVAPSRRTFCSSARSQLEYFPPARDAPNIKKTGPAWHHPVYSEQHMKAIAIAHKQTSNWSDKFALFMMKVFRFGMDTATGYKHDKAVSLGNKDPTTGDQPRKWAMNERKWMIRFVFLESVAGVPGMVAGMLRHLHSLRRMKRDNGWIETLLEEAYNERMHLLTFMKMAEPGWFMRFMILGAQGVFFNGMFLSYLISPRTCHRFVGYLEEEAVITYTRAIADIEAGRLPAWKDGKVQAPDIAINYWNMPEGKRSMKDLLLYIRADEAKHREVNHTLGNLAQKEDPNPFVSEYTDDSKPHPSKGIENIKSTGWDRREVL